jgi:acyl dehydratase
MTSRYFEEIEVGDSCKAGPYFVIIQFAKQFDPRPFHLDEEAAARSVFAGLSASHVRDFHIVNQQVTASAPCPCRNGLGQLRLPNPVRPGDELDLEVTALEKRESKSKPDRGIVRNQVRLRNQRREIVLQAIGNILVARRPDAKAAT